MTGEPYTAIGSDGTIGPPHLGLSPERVKVLNEEARVRIAAENVCRAARAAEKAQRKQAAKEKKLAARGENHDGSDDGKIEIGRRRKPHSSPSSEDI